MRGCAQARGERRGARRLKVGQHDEADEADLRRGHQRAVARAQRRHRQPLRPLPVPLREELLQHTLRPAACQAEGPARVGQVRGVQQVGAQLVQPRRARRPAAAAVRGAELALEVLHELEVVLHVGAEGGEDDLPVFTGRRRGCQLAGRGVIRERSQSLSSSRSDKPNRRYFERHDPNRPILF